MWQRMKEKYVFWGFLFVFFKLMLKIFFLMTDGSCEFTVFLLSLYICKTSHQQGVREGKSHRVGWGEKKKKTICREEEGKNYGAFKLIPKAPIGVCIVLFFITFQWFEHSGPFFPLQIKSGVHYWMMRLFIAVKWVNHEGAPFFFRGRERRD